LAERKKRTASQTFKALEHVGEEEERLRYVYRPAAADH